MFRNLVWVFLVAIVIVSCGEYNKKYPQLKYNSPLDKLKHPFDTRVRYRIGNVDSQFGLSENEIKQLAEQATKIWTDGTSKEWFVYDENARLTVNLIYDDRQKNTTERLQLEQKIDNQIKSQAITEQALQNEKQVLEDEWQLLQTQIDIFNKKSELAHLNNENTTLQNLHHEKMALEQQLAAYKTKENLVNQKINQYNQTQTDINHSINIANKKYPPREFHKGVFNGREINIYEYKSLDDLRLTLAHEFGHALDIEHHSDPKGLMYTHAGEQDMVHFKLQQSDLNLLREKHR